MRKSFLLLLALAAAVPVSSEAAQVPDYKKPSSCGCIGEKITYDVTLGIAKLGSATFHYPGNTHLAHKRVCVLTFTTKLLRFQDTEKIYADPETFLPLKVERDIASWPKYEKITEQYNQKDFMLTITKKTGSHTQETSIKKNGVIQNAIMLPYAVRGLPELKGGWTSAINLPTQKFTITLVNREEVKVPAGTFEAYHFRSTPDRFEIWISDDGRRIPLKIKGATGIGYILSMRTYTSGKEPNR